MLSERHAINSWPQLSQYTTLTAECDKQLWFYDTEFAVLYPSALTQVTSCLIIFQNLNTSACSVFSFLPPSKSNYSGFHWCLSVLTIVSGSKWKDLSSTSNETSFINLKTAFNAIFQPPKLGMDPHLNNVVSVLLRASSSHWKPWGHRAGRWKLGP